MATDTKEKDFEKHIADHLADTAGYTRLLSADYDRARCLFPAETIAFLRDTQPDAVAALEEQYGTGAEDKILGNIERAIKANGTLHVLRAGVKDRGQHLRLCYFSPANSKNAEHAALFEKNRFGVVRQLYFSQKTTESIDLVLVLNGLPLFTAEVKNALTGQYLEQAIKQYKEDRDPAEPLLSYKRCLAHFALSTEKASVATKLDGAATRFLPFNQDVENPVNPAGFKTAYIWEDLWSRVSVLDLVQNFLHYQREKEKYFDEKTGALREREVERAIFPRFHQRRAVYKLLGKVREEGAGHHYLIQHSAGSGKSNTIAWLAHRLAGFFRNPDDASRLFDSIIVVTDRRVLDKQLQSTISQFAQVPGVVVAIDDKCTSQDLKRAIEGGKAVIITTLQKFPVISESIQRIPNRAYAVIIDEAHSSQTGEASRKMRKTLSPEEAARGEEEGEERSLDDLVLEEIERTGRQPNLSLFAFTATPKPKTLELFGRRGAGKLGETDLYSMEQAIKEGFILDVLKLYLSFKRYYTLSKRADVADDKSYEQRKAVRLLSSYVDLQDTAFDTKSRIMLEHFVDTTAKEIGGRARAMVVTRSRLHAVRYKLKFDTLMKGMRLPYRALVAFSGAVHDPETGEDYTEAGMNNLAGAMSIPEAFKTPAYRILIVAEKYQTGFDEPLLHTMFVDKKLSGVATVQTLSRLNRTHPEKRSTLVLDFVNDTETVQEDFSKYYTANFMLEGSETDPNELYDLLSTTEAAGVYNKATLEAFGEIFFRTGDDKQLLQPILGECKKRYDALTEEEQDGFRAAAANYCRMYRFLSIIITFKDVDLEKQYVFLSHLLRALPIEPTELPVEVLSQVELSAYKVQRVGEASISLVSDAGELYGMTRKEGGGGEDDPQVLLSEIIKKLNETYGLNLKEADRADLEAVHGEIVADAELATYFNGQNSKENIRDKFEEKLDEALLRFINGKLDLYNALSENKVNERLKKLWFDGLWRGRDPSGLSSRL